MANEGATPNKLRQLWLSLSEDLRQAIVTTETLHSRVFKLTYSREIISDIHHTITQPNLNIVDLSTKQYVPTILGIDSPLLELPAVVSKVNAVFEIIQIGEIMRLMVIKLT